MPKQSQSQRQSVVVNIGTSKTKSKPRKSRGRGGLPPPSYQHNLAPTFVTQQATDYTPIIGAIQGLTAKLNEQPRIQQPVTPLSSTVQGNSAQQMAGEAALRRAGHTAGNFQPLPSQADERLAQETQDKLDVKDKQAFEQNVSGGGGQKNIRRRTISINREISSRWWQRIPQAEALPKRGRPPKGIQQAIPVNPPQQAQAEEPKRNPPQDKKMWISCLNANLKNKIFRKYICLLRLLSGSLHIQRKRYRLIAKV